MIVNKIQPNTTETVTVDKDDRIAKATLAPPVYMAEVPQPMTSEVGELPIAEPRQARMMKSLIIRTFQSLDALVVAIVAVFGCMVASDVSLAQTSFGIAAPFLALPFMLIWGLAASGAYQFEYGDKLVRRWAKTAGVLAVMVILDLAMAQTLRMPEGAFLIIVMTSLLMGAALLFLQVIYSALVRYWSHIGLLASNVVIVGATENARSLIRQSAQCKDLNMVAVFDDRASRRPDDIEDVPVVGGMEDLLAWNGLHTIDQIIITVTSTASRRVNELVDQLRTLPQEVVLFMDIDGFHKEEAQLTEIARSPMAYVSGAPRNEMKIFAKRVQDLTIALGMLVVFAPVMAVIALLIRLDSPGPVLFRQKRHGFNNRIIEVFKFRTMWVDDSKGEMQQVQKDDERVTRLGRFLRRTSLDELPQLFNVLAGNMSLVGPRPHAVGMRTGDVESWKLVAHYAHRHRVKPGLTGWAQINGSRGPLDNAEQVRERVRLDVDYIRRAGFWFDLWIMLKTGPCLLGDSEAIR